MTVAVDSALVVAAARGWIGTPYRHQASVRGAGCDCLGLLRGLWREIIGPEPEAPPAYAPFTTDADETLTRALGRWLADVPPRAARPGDILLFRVRRHGPARHIGVLSAPGLMIHAWEPTGTIETPLTTAWRRRQVAVFRFPAPPQQT